MLIASQVAPGKPEILHCADMTDAERVRLHGHGGHTDLQQLTVGEATTVVFEFTIGEQVVQQDGRLMVVWRWPFDWSDLQSDDPGGSGYLRLEVELAGGRDPDSVMLLPKYNWIAGIEPWHHQLQVQVREGQLQCGDLVRVVCGDTQSGGAGWRAPTCVADRCRFLMLIDHNGSGQRIRLPDAPTFQVVPGPATRIVAVAESDARVNQPCWLIVKAEDKWGNAAALDSAPVVTCSDADLSPLIREVEPPSATRPARRYQLTFSQSATCCARVQAGQLRTRSNPITVWSAEPERRLFWGDLHSGQTEIGCGCGSLAEHYAFGRDCAGLQFITHQANDHYVTQDDWEHTRRVTAEFDAPGQYVVLLGCEWSPLTKDGGDRNVIYSGDEPLLRRSDRFFREEPADPTPDVRTAPEFHDAFRDRDVLVNIHVGGRMTNLEWYEPSIERLCETHSTHGTVEWFVHDVLDRGYRVGLTAGTDGVMGRPGACHPGRRLIRNLRNGLTAIYARELTREALWAALQARCCYATTGERIRVWFEVNQQPMGAACVIEGKVQGRLDVQGTQPLERIDLFRGTDVIASWNVAARDDSDPPLLRILWQGTQRKGTARLQRVNWNGSLTTSSGNLKLEDSVNFQSIDDQATTPSVDRIEWSSATAGSSAGILVRALAEDSATLRFNTEAATFEFAVRDVLREDLVIEAGGLNRQVRVGRAPVGSGPTEFAIDFADDPLAGEWPYWIRVVQIDQSQAWSSPVYVTRK